MSIYDEAYLCGIMIGDGCLSSYKPKSSGRKYVINLALNRITDRDFCYNFVVPLLKKFTDKSVRVQDRPKYGKLEVVVYSKDLLNYMHTKWNFPVGKKGQIQIPNRFLKNVHLFRRVIAGIFATDGTVIFSKQHKQIPYYPRFEFCSISVPLMDQLENYFRSNGYRCSRWSIRLAINGFKGVNRFIKEIGLINSSKQQRVEKTAYQAGRYWFL